MATLVLLKAMVERYGIELRRYYFNTLSLLMTFYVIFLVIFFGMRTISGGNPSFGSTTGGVVVGFMVWFLTIFTYAELSFVLIQEAQEGTLEQLAMSPLGLRKVLLARLTAALVFNTLVMLIFLLLMMFSTGKWLHLDFVSILPLLLLTIAGVQGIGLATAGLALVFKQLQAFLQIMQFVFLALIAVPIKTFPLVKYLPLSWGTHLIEQVMVKGIVIWGIPLGDLLFLLVNSALYLILGFLSFKYFERIARDRGLLGQY